MRHLKAGRKLNRTSSHRKALMRNLVTSLIWHEKIETTSAKAKELRSIAEKTITIAKRGKSNAHQEVFKTIKNKEVMKKLFASIAGRYSSRNGGYTRIIPVGNRRGDCASMSIIELVDREELPKKEKKVKSEKAEKKVKSDKKEKVEKKKKAA